MGSDENTVTKNRTTALLKMATKVALREGKSFFEKKAEQQLAKMLDQADVIVKQVGQLKGAAMKAVQMVSVEAQDLLPPEVLQVLEKLQSQAPPLSNEVMIEELRSELGPQRFSEIKNLSSQPIASASIGQVYRGDIDGQSVVIKIQYPGVADSVDQDLRILKKLVQALLVLARKRIDMDALFVEMKRVLKLETNYLNEVEQLLKYKAFFQGETQYKIPEVYPELSTSKVIVLSNEEGLEFTDWLKTNPSLAMRETIGISLLNLYMEEFFKNQLVQTDPNPANFLINHQNQLVLLDFGATISYSDEFVTDYKALLRTVFSGSDDEILQKIQTLGFVSPKETDEVKNDFVQFIKLSLLPFSEDLQPFDFGSEEYPEQVRETVLSFSKKLKHSAPPSNIIFLHRKLGGIFQMLRKLGVKIDITPYRDMILKN